MQSLPHFLGVALEQAGEDFSTGGFADGEPDALLGVVEVVAECERNLHGRPSHHVRVIG